MNIPRPWEGVPGKMCEFIVSLCKESPRRSQRPRKFPPVNELGHRGGRRCPVLTAGLWAALPVLHVTASCLPLTGARLCGLGPLLLETPVPPGAPWQMPSPSTSSARTDGERLAKDPRRAGFPRFYGGVSPPAVTGLLPLVRIMSPAPGQALLPGPPHSACRGTAGLFSGQIPRGDAHWAGLSICPGGAAGTAVCQELGSGFTINRATMTV